MKIGKIAVVLAAVFAVALGTAQASYVTIGDAGNADDTADGDDDTTGVQHYGAVDYEYQISTTEVSEDDWESAISGTSGNDLPRINTSLYGAMEYANALTEAEHGGISDYNVYSLETGGDPHDSDDYSGYSINYSRDTALSEGNLVYAIPTEDEWYKAAYYDASGSEGYSLYADGTDTAPPEGSAGTADDGWNYDPTETNSIGEQAVGFSSLEQNGTRDMMGNVWEWQEDTGGVIRGGDYSRYADHLCSSGRDTGRDPTKEGGRIGFRVVAIPEPVSGGLFVLVVGLLWFVRRRARA